MPDRLIKDVADVLQEEIQQIVDFINMHEVEIGVVDGSSSRKAKFGLNNAELMFIHENGSALRNIPARPVLDMTIQYAKDELIDKLFDTCIVGVLEKGWSNDDIEQELNRFCMRLQNYARKIIYSNDGRLAANAPSTIKQKGYNHPLFQTGQLTRSITCRLVKK